MSICSCCLVEWGLLWLHALRLPSSVCECQSIAVHTISGLSLAACPYSHWSFATIKYLNHVSA